MRTKEIKNAKTSSTHTTKKSATKNKKKCIAVTGGFGFLGSVIVRKLREQNYYVRLLRHSSRNRELFQADKYISIVDGDVSVIEDVERLCEGVDGIIHAASFVSIVNYQKKQLAKVNIEGTKNVLTVCKKLGIKKLVYISSVEAMGKVHEGVHDEMEGFHPECALIPYGKSKAIASQMVYSFGALYKQEHECSVSIVSPGGIIGPFDEGTSDIGNMVKMYLKRRLGAYPAKGGFCFVDVRDVANATIMLVNKREDSNYYIAAGEYVSVHTMMKTLQEVSNIPKPFFKIPLWIMYGIGIVFEFWSMCFGGHPIFTTGSVKVLRSCLRVNSSKIQETLGIKFRPTQESFKDQVTWYMTGEASLQ